MSIKVRSEMGKQTSQDKQDYRRQIVTQKRLFTRCDLALSDFQQRRTFATFLFQAEYKLLK